MNGLFNLDAERDPLWETRPLAHRMRPEHLEEMVGPIQSPSLRSLIAKWISENRLPSLLIWGPPGCGKTTFAKALSKKIRAEWVELNAAFSGTKEIKAASELARDRRLTGGVRTVVFIDEIHRLNKAQQDLLLPDVESGNIVLIGATTEHPGYEINRALLSRMRLIQLDRLKNSDIVFLLKRSLSDKRGLKNRFQVQDSVIESIASQADGDARAALARFEAFLDAVECTRAQSKSNSSIDVSEQDYTDFVQSDPMLKLPAYDRNSNEHHELASALIKSIRGTDPDAAVYYLARMLSGGEDVRFIARRLMILASEDIGNADPRALTLAVSTLQAVEAVGMPEARIVLSQAVVYLALAPKSNSSYVAIDAALEEVQKSGSVPIPLMLKNARTEIDKVIGTARGYQYAHDFEHGVPIAASLPEELKSRRFLELSEQGFEKSLRAKWKVIQEWRNSQDTQ